MMLNLLNFSLSNTGRRGHEFKLYKPQARLDIRKNFFTVRVIDEWNHLPDKILHCSTSTLQTFKEHLECSYLKNRGYN